jgi:hypothetical protein
MTDVAKDLDETRRLLYGALAASRTRRWELVGTLTNALVHHSGLETDAGETLEKLVDLVEDDANTVWARGLIEKLTTAINEDALGTPLSLKFEVGAAALTAGTAPHTTTTYSTVYP